MYSSTGWDSQQRRWIKLAFVLVVGETLDQVLQSEMRVIRFLWRGWEEWRSEVGGVGQGVDGVGAGREEFIQAAQSQDVPSVNDLTTKVKL